MSLAFSTIGLIVAVVSYSAIGGLIFLKLEVENEKQQMEITRKNVSINQEVSYVKVSCENVRVTSHKWQKSAYGLKIFFLKLLVRRPR